MGREPPGEAASQGVLLSGCSVSQYCPCCSFDHHYAHSYDQHHHDYADAHDHEAHILAEPPVTGVQATTTPDQITR